MTGKINKFMFANWAEHLDDANCLNMTALAESAAMEFGEGEDIPEEYFEVAFTVQQRLRREGLINQ